MAKRVGKVTPMCDPKTITVAQSLIYRLRKNICGTEKNRGKIFSREDIFAKISSRENISNSLFAKFSSRENNVLYSTFTLLYIFHYLHTRRCRLR